MTTRTTCPGCSRQISTGALWCAPCGKRMPSRIQQAVTQAERSLRAAAAEGVTWLGRHPRATPRELDILALAAQGRTNQEIAEDLHLGYETVRSGIRGVSKRWGCRGRAHTIATAFQLGYLTIGRQGETV